ncbi:MULTISPECIES: S24 family peptidase [Vibrio]|nr:MULTISPECIES: S24 family peptidase [Vibrio]
MGYDESDHESKKRNSDPFPEGRKGSIKDRLLELKRGRTNRDLAKAWNIPLSTLTGYINRGSIPPVDTAFSIAVIEGVSIEWLVTGSQKIAPPTNEGYSSTHERILEKPKYNVAAAAGGGSFIDSVTPIEYYPFTYNYLKRNKLLHANLCIIEARGESMEPTIESGDDLLIKLIDEMPAKPFEGVYVVRMENHLRVKRLEYDIVREGYRVISDNKLHSEEFVSKNDFDNFLVVGEVAKVIGKPSELVHCTD